MARKTTARKKPVAKKRGTKRPDFGTDIALKTAYEAQAVVGRVLFEGFHLSDEQCRLMASAIRDGHELNLAAMELHLTLNEVPIDADLSEKGRRVLLGVYLSALTRVDAYLIPEEITEPRAARKVAIEDTTMQLADDPLSLTETASGR